MPITTNNCILLRIFSLLSYKRFFTRHRVLLVSPSDVSGVTISGRFLLVRGAIKERTLRPEKDKTFQLWLKWHNEVARWTTSAGVSVGTTIALGQWFCTCELSWSDVFKAICCNCGPRCWNPIFFSKISYTCALDAKQCCKDMNHCLQINLFLWIQNQSYGHWVDGAWQWAVKFRDVSQWL